MLSRFVRTTTRLGLVVSVLLATGWLLAPTQAATSVGVHGVVTAADGSGPIGGIEVCVIGKVKTSGSLYRCSTTAEDGTYAIVLKAGTYRFSARDPYLYGDWVEQSYQGGKAYSFGSSTNRTVSFRMVRGARVSGYLTTPEGDRPGNNYTSAEACRVRKDGSIPASYYTFSNVNSDGYYSVSKLPAGTYKIFLSDHDSPVRFAQQWYPDSTTASASTPVTVTTGAEVSLDDAALNAPGSLRITTRARDGSLTRGSFAVYDADNRFVAEAGEGVYRSAHTLDGPHPGIYKVQARAYEIGYFEWYSHKRSAATANLIEVVAGAATAKTITFHPPRLKSVKKPTVTFDDPFLRSTAGTWSKRPQHVRRELIRDGKRVRRDVGNLHRVTEKDVGHRLKICVVASRPGYADGRACSRYTPKIKRS